MKYDKYTEVEVTFGFSIYDFNSIGPLGVIPKRVQISETSVPGIFNLAFGNLDGNGKIDDYAISNDKDRNKILATIAGIVINYLDKFPNRIILFSGSTVERTRLYRMAISLNFTELSKTIDIYAIVDGEPLHFNSNVNAEAFIIKRKT
ncbi:hypothetical protein QEG73_00055 [Chitinophagaceae bacterium 26-R-25]|nr:hypothetical protein [Chitinophagaceae bacterium 26-R-25]